MTSLISTIGLKLVKMRFKKSGGQNNQLLIIFFWTYHTVPVSEFRHFFVRNKESWEKWDITDPVVLMNDAESKFRSLKEDKLWVTNNPMKANMLDLTMVIGNIIRQLYSKGTMKQCNSYFENSNPSTVTSGNND